MSETIWAAIGLMLIFEGVGPLLFPNRWKSYMQLMVNEGASSLRRVGGVLCVIGLMILLN